MVTHLTGTAGERPILVSVRMVRESRLLIPYLEGPGIVGMSMQCHGHGYSPCWAGVKAVDLKLDSKVFAGHMQDFEL